MQIKNYQFYKNLQKFKLKHYINNYVSYLLIIESNMEVKYKK